MKSFNSARAGNYLGAPKAVGRVVANPVLYPNTGGMAGIQAVLATAKLPRSKFKTTTS